MVAVLHLGGVRSRVWHHSRSSVRLQSSRCRPRGEVEVGGTRGEVGGRYNRGISCCWWIGDRRCALEAVCYDHSGRLHFSTFVVGLGSIGGPALLRLQWRMSALGDVRSGMLRVRWPRADVKCGDAVNVVIRWWPRPRIPTKGEEACGGLCSSSVSARDSRKPHTSRSSTSQLGQVAPPSHPYEKAGGRWWVVFVRERPR